MQGAVAIEPAFSAQRRAMVDGQIRTFDVTDQAVIQAFLEVPRELFVPAEWRSLAYSDAVLTLKGASARVMLQPMHLARLLQGAAVQSTDRALVVAGGTGYAACVLAHLVAHVVTLDSDAAFSAKAAALVKGLGVGNVDAVTGDVVAGHAGQGPYDIILVPGAVETNLDTLFGQLSPTGRLVTIETKTGEATRRAGKAIRFQRIAGDISVRPLFDATAPAVPEFLSSAKFEF